MNDETFLNAKVEKIGVKRNNRTLPIRLNKVIYYARWNNEIRTRLGDA